MQGADLVAVRIAQIGEIHLANGALAHARRVFTGRAAIGDAGSVPGVGLRRRGATAKPIVPPLATVAGLPSIGKDTEKTPVGVR